MGFWNCYPSRSVLVPRRTNKLASCSLLQVGSLVVRQWIWDALFFTFLRDISVNVILSQSWEQLRVPKINRIWICCFYIGLKEMKNAAFGVMAYRPSRTLCDGNGVEPLLRLSQFYLFVSSYFNCSFKEPVVVSLRKLNNFNLSMDGNWCKY